MKLAGIVIFFLALCLPAIQKITGVLPPYTIDENRRLTAPPRLADFKDPATGFHQFEQYFDDHYGLRDILIRLKTQIDFSVFHTSDRVHLGKNGWLFYRSVLDVEKPATERFFASRDEQLTAGIEDLAAALKKRSQTLVLMPIFLGDVFYHDELPRDTPKLPQPSGFYRATERWKTLPNLIYVDSAAVLSRVKERRQVFHKTDFHWNSPAAFAVGRTFVNQLGQDAGIKSPVWDHELKIETRPYIGRESDFLPLFKQPSELGLFVVPTWNTNDVQVKENQGIFEYITTKRVDDSKTLPPLCIVGDSFFDALRDAGFTSYFSKVYRVRWQGADTLPRALAQFPAECKYVMVEFIEVQAPAFDSLADGAANLRGPH
ncbi:alginate O-acetyltransferase AlgX-related protein [Paraburkholderia acidiphila]|uniref:AlgX/AlgJ SGNH hydrolase-like domain-containing protein n=1 Tax=Paraburkholderia acidiphila TaxID=2571747 RepID=A0A7Z2J7C8_9BURK|nr:hypothetical protein [Paraburkholderia acidiphila]QGZ54006.1 hypothetical protein FAZ97_03225 [Paraburkholderia acidiphila]